MVILCCFVRGMHGGVRRLVLDFRTRCPSRVVNFANRVHQGGRLLFVVSVKSYVECEYALHHDSVVCSTICECVLALAVARSRCAYCMKKQVFCR